MSEMYGPGSGSPDNQYAGIIREWRNGAPWVTAHTSGSTGTPKTIRLSRALVRASAWRTIQFFGLDRSSVLYSCLSPDTIGGKMVAIRATECAASFGYETPSNSPLAAFGPDDRLTMVSVVPSQLHHLLERHSCGTLPHIETILCGGAPLPDTMRERIAKANLPVWESYGMTETASHVAVRRVTDGPLNPFIPLPGISMKLDNRGCMVIDLGDSTEIVTNDMARMLPDGGFVITGRYDNMVISGGRKINPEEVERLIGCTVSAMPHEKWGECLVAVTESGEPGCDSDELVKRILAIRPHWMRPKAIVRVPRIPRVASGKVCRTRLKQILSDRNPEIIAVLSR